MRDQRRSVAPGARHLGRERLHPRRPGPPAPVQRRPRDPLPSLPIDVAAADIQNAPTPDTGEQSVNGAYAWVITDSGIVYLVNINPILRGYSAVVHPAPPPPPAPTTYSVLTAPPGMTESEPFVNTLRDRNVISYSITLDPGSGRRASMSCRAFP